MIIDMTKELKLAKNTAIIAIGSIGTKLINFLLLPLYTSILTTSEYGTLDLISTNVALLTVVLTLQFDQGMFRFLVEARNDSNRIKRIILTSLFSVLIVNLILSGLLIPILNHVKYEYTFYLIIWMFLSSISTLINQIPRGLGYNIIFSAAGFINGTTTVLFSILFVKVCGFGLDGLIWAYLIASIVTILYVLIRIRFWTILDLHSIDFEIFKTLSKYSFPLIPYTMCWWVISASDRWFIKGFLGVSYNGIYTVAYKFPSLFAIVTSIFQTAWTESAAEAIQSNDHDSYYNKMVNLGIKVYSSGNLLIITLLPFVFNLLVKKEFSASYNYIPILLIGALLSSISALYGSIYFAFKKTNEVAWTAAVSAIINLAINYFFIKEFGLYAAAFSTFLAYVIAVIIRHFDIRKLVKIHISMKYIFIEFIVYVCALYCYYSNSIYLRIIC